MTGTRRHKGRRRIEYFGCDEGPQREDLLEDDVAEP
jgi:hypothetical protein